MSNFIQEGSIIAIHPGFYLVQMINDGHITEFELAEKLNITLEKLYAILNGEASLTQTLADKIALCSSTSSELWVNLQNNFNENIALIDQSKLELK